MKCLRSLCALAFATACFAGPTRAHAQGFPPAPGSTTPPIATSTPTPAPPTPTPGGTPAPNSAPQFAEAPNALRLSGYARVYDFDRTNKVQDAADTNSSAFNVGALLRVDYHVGASPVHIGAGYYAAYPFGLNGTQPQTNRQIDNTLPGYSLSTLGQLYLRYDDGRAKGAVGKLLYNGIWAPASDSRLKPALYQGIDGTYALTPNVDVGASRLTAFENRNSSAFERQTLLSTAPSAGLVTAHAAYHNATAFANASYWGFYDYANLYYFEGAIGLAPGSDYRPSLAFQYANESQAGRALMGRIQNNTFGAKLGAILNRNVAFSLGFDDQPIRYATVAAGSVAAAGAGFALPSGGTGTVRALGGGSYRVAYGGILSPYTDNYANDPLYTTSITQGAVDRRSPGTSYKASLTFASDNKRVIAVLSEAYYDYSNDISRNDTYETNIDVTFHFSPPKQGSYHGLSLRERFANRTQPTAPVSFQYIRTQLQYDF